MAVKKLFNRSHLTVKPLTQRDHDLNFTDISSLKCIDNHRLDGKMHEIGNLIIEAKKKGASIILMVGGHVIRAGVQRYLIDLMKRGYISCIAMNGSGMIHDFEFSMIGATTESVARYINEGQFGLWKETGQLNDIVNKAYSNDKSVGMGEAVGRYIHSSDFPHKSISILYKAYKLKIPVTIHVGVGCDIIHEHPNCDGAATGALTYNDFLKYAYVLQGLENGVLMNFGSAVMGPEVFLKALSMVRNVARKNGATVRHFTSLVCDLHDLPDEYTKEPPKSNPFYYFRPWKTILARSVADGGRSFYIQGNHRETIPALWKAVSENEKG